eukprot:5453907-Prymnesium_polylepis.1
MHASCEAPRASHQPRPELRGAQILSLRCTAAASAALRGASRRATSAPRGSREGTASCGCRGAFRGATR